LKEFRYEWIWKKNRPTGHLDANRRPLRQHECVLIFCDRGPAYNPQVSYTAPRKSSGSRTQSTNYNDYSTSPDKIVNYRYPTDIIECDKDDCNLHPTQKPVSLCEYLIRTYTDEGMTVLDNCMGSGTTGVAAVQAGCNFIGIEKDPGYYEIAVDRIGKAEYKAKTRTTLEAFT